MTLVEGSPKKRIGKRIGQALGIALTAAAIALPCGAVDQAAQPPWHGELAAARAPYYAGVDGNRDAINEARQRFDALAQQHPHNTTLEAYQGSLELLEASHTWALGRKHALSVEGIERMDSAVNADPNNLEARFVRALTTWHLPYFFHRKEIAEGDLLFLGPRSEQAAQTGELPPNLAAAALDYWGQVLAERDQPDAARKAYASAVRVDRSCPAGEDALKRLR